MKELKDIEKEQLARVKRYYRTHLDKVRTYKRNAYRIKVGIPLNQELSKRGRPREW